MNSKQKLRLVSSSKNVKENTAIPLKLRSVILDHPIAQWHDPFVRDLFVKIIQLKIDGYRGVYPKGMLPIDTSDFVGTHIVVCSEERTLVPILAYRSVSYDRCQKSRITFGSIANLTSSKVERSLPRLEKIIQATDGQISHDSSWTVDPRTRETPELKKYTRDLLTTLIYYHHQSLGPKQWITCGVKRFKTDLYFEWLGLKAITEDFNLYSSFDEPVKMFHCEELSQAAIATAKSNVAFWNSAIILSPDKNLEKMAA